MFKNWKIKKEDLENKSTEYAKVAQWCNDSGEYHIDEVGSFYKVVKNPEPTAEEIAQRVKAERDDYMASTLAKIDRYEKQAKAEITTTDTEDDYKSMLVYLQYLRDIPQSENFPFLEVLNFENWRAKQ